MPAKHRTDREFKLCSVLNLLGLFRLQGMTEDGLKSLCFTPVPACHSAYLIQSTILIIQTTVCVCWRTNM